MILWYALLYPIVLSFDAYLYRKILCLLLFTCIWFVLIQEAYYLAKVLSRYLKFNCLFPVTLWAGLPEEILLAKPVQRLCEAWPMPPHSVCPESLSLSCFLRQGSQGTSLSHRNYIPPLSSISGSVPRGTSIPLLLCFRSKERSHLIFYFLSCPDLFSGSRDRSDELLWREYIPGEVFWFVHIPPGVVCLLLCITGEFPQG